MNEMYMKKLTAVAASATVAAFAFSHNPAKAETEILFNIFPPAKLPIVAGMTLPWAMELNKALKGKVVFKIPAKSLAPAPRQMDIVTSGVADAAFVFNAFIIKRVPHVRYSFLPQMSTTAVADGVASWRTYEKYFAAKNAFKDVKLLSLFAGPSTLVYNIKKPIRNLADLKGLKIWALPGPMSQLLSKLGAGVVPGPATRVYPIVSKGTVDAFAGLNMADAIGFNVIQFAKSVTDIPGSLFSPTFSLFMSKAKWEGLPKDVQRIIESKSGESFARRAVNYDNPAIKATKEFREKSGKPWYKPEPDLMNAIIKIANEMQDGWVKQMNELGIDGRAALNFHKATAKQVAAERK